MIKINCDLCGKVDEMLMRALVEGVELRVCSNCSKFGQVLGPVRIPLPPEKKKLKEEVLADEKMEVVVENYAALIRAKRESMVLTQKDFANKLSEKESTLHKIETGIWHPDLALARKLEKMLGIKLIEEHLEKHVIMKKRKDEGYTLGDFIKIKD